MAVYKTKALGKPHICSKVSFYHIEQANFLFRTSWIFVLSLGVLANHLPQLLGSVVPVTVMNLMKKY